MTFGGLLFLLGGIAIVLIPGSLPTWVDVAYVAFGIVGSERIRLLWLSTVDLEGTRRTLWTDIRRSSASSPF